METTKKIIGDGVEFDHYGRITGYLAKLSRWSNSKAAEYKDRVKHTVERCSCNK